MREYEIIIAENVRRYTTWKVRLTDEEARELGALETRELMQEDHALINGTINHRGGEVERVDHYEADELETALIGVDATDGA